MIGQLPWLALSLLLATNITLGGSLSAWHEPWSAWIVVTLCILLIAAILSRSWLTIRDSFAYSLLQILKHF